MLLDHLCVCLLLVFILHVSSRGRECNGGSCNFCPAMKVSLMFYCYFCNFLFQLESICEETTTIAVLDENPNLSSDFLPVLRSGEWSDIGGRDYMEDTHVCIPDLAKNMGCEIVDEEAVSFYGVSSLVNLFMHI